MYDFFPPKKDIKCRFHEFFSLSFKGTYFNAQPIITRYGTCFSTKSAELQHEISIAGEGSGLTVVTMHDPGNPFDRSLAPAELIGTIHIYMISNFTKKKST